MGYRVQVNPEDTAKGICWHAWWGLRENLGASEVCDFPVAQMVKNLPTMQKTWVLFLGQDDPLEKGRATHFSILARRIPWMRMRWSDGITDSMDMSLRETVFN